MGAQERAGAAQPFTPASVHPSSEVAPAGLGSANSGLFDCPCCGDAVAIAAADPHRFAPGLLWIGRGDVCMTAAGPLCGLHRLVTNVGVMNA